MARDVEFNVTAGDKTGPALNAAARKFEQTQKRIRDDAEKAFGGVGRSLIAAANLAGPKVGAAVTRGIASAAQAAGPMLASVGAYAAPLIAGTLSAAIVGGAGIGGVIGGVVLAARDPRVKAAGAKLGENMMADLTDAARPFVSVTLGAIDDIQAGFDQVRGNIQRIMANSAKFVGPLTEGVVAFAQGLVRGFDVLVQKAGPTINAIRDGLTQLGAGVEDFFATVAGDGVAAAAAMKTLFDGLTGTLAVLGPIIRGLSEINAALDRIGMSGGLLQTINRLSQFGEGSGEVSRAALETAKALERTLKPAASYATILDGILAASRRLAAENGNLYAAQTASAQAFETATAEIKKNGRALNLTTDAGIANRGVLSQLASALNTEYDAFVKVNGAGDQANEVLRRNRERFVAAAQAATGSAAAASRLADELIGIPDRRPKVELLDRASGKINNVINRLAALRDKRINVTVAVRQSGDAAALRKQDQTGYSAAAQYAAAAPGGGTYRSQRPTPVSVTSEVNVLLDGRPIDAKITSAVRQSEERAAWRQRVGKR